MIEISKIPEMIYEHPKRIKKYILVWCASGSVSMVIDENEFLLQANEVITITSGQYHFFKETENVEGYVLTFTYDFFCKDDNSIELIFHNSLFCHFDLNEVIKVDLSALLGQLEIELTKKDYQHLIYAHSLVEVILVTINRSKIAAGGDIWKPDALFLKFLDTVRTNFKNPFTLTQIAEKLGTTVTKLNELSKTHTGKTAQAVIHGLLVSEAKRLFIYEKLSIKEVAYTLGFKDPFYFSAFFKKHNGQSPKAYREKHMLL